MKMLSSANCVSLLVFRNVEFYAWKCSIRKDGHHYFMIWHHSLRFNSHIHFLKRSVLIYNATQRLSFCGLQQLLVSVQMLFHFLARSSLLLKRLIASKMSEGPSLIQPRHQYVAATLIDLDRISAAVHLQIPSPRGCCLAEQ
jgi:hypothetical protein